jgi:RNA polymerase sigma-70 factor (ECF subfamily)
MLTAGELVLLLMDIAKGDEAAFEQLYAGTRAKLYGVVLRILRRSDLADKVIQDTYVEVWRGAGEFDPAIATPITWMVAIARNRALDLLRGSGEPSIEAERAVENEPAAVEVAGDAPDPLARHEMTAELRRLLACLGNLEEERRRLLLLAYYSGYSREQLAVKFDRPVSMVKTWLRRGLLQIRECLRP